MKVLVTGGTGVVGEAVIRLLLARNHNVRLLSRHASKDRHEWDGLEGRDGDVADARSIVNAAAGCDAVIHIAGIASENPPETTFDAVNVDGTKNMLAEAERSGVSRFLFISSLGADRGESDYHRSKREAEDIVRRSSIPWTIIRPGNVYGPGDEVISTILKMVRALPAVPVIDKGDHEFQPIWHEDLAEVIVTAMERDEMAEQTLEAAGPEVTTMNDLLSRFATITGRKPMRVPVPMALAQITSRLAGAVAKIPVDDNKLTMLREENRIDGRNAAELLGTRLTPLDEGLRMLADALEEKLPEEGIGGMKHKRFSALIEGTRHSPASLMALFRERVNEVMPIEFVAEPGAAERVERGATLTAALPLRGNIQVRVEVVEPTRVVFGTIEGHPLAGIVEFTTEARGSAIEFAIDTWTRAGSAVDWLALKFAGEAAQSANWRAVVQRVIDASGGTSDGVHESKEHLDEEQAAAVETRVRSMIQERKRDEHTNGDSAPNTR